MGTSVVWPETKPSHSLGFSWIAAVKNTYLFKYGVKPRLACCRLRSMLEILVRHHASCFPVILPPPQMARPKYADFGLLSVCRGQMHKLGKRPARPSGRIAARGKSNVVMVMVHGLTEVYRGQTILMVCRSLSVSGSLLLHEQKMRTSISILAL